MLASINMLMVCLISITVRTVDIEKKCLKRNDSLEFKKLTILNQNFIPGGILPPNFFIANL